MKEAVCFSYLRLSVLHLHLHNIHSEEGWNYLLFAQTTKEQRGLGKLHLHQICAPVFIFFLWLQASGRLNYHIFSCACVSVSVWTYGAHLGDCTGRRRPAWHCIGVSWSGRADRGTRTRFRGRWESEAAGPPLPPVPLSRSPSAACPESQRHSSPATRLAPWGGNRQARHRLTLRLLDI